MPGIVSDDAAVFWMKPDAGPRAVDRRSVTVAQLTMVSNGVIIHHYHTALAVLPALSSIADRGDGGAAVT